MKKHETREETLERLAKDARSGTAAAKRFESLVRRMIKTPPQPRTVATKPRD